MTGLSVPQSPVLVTLRDIELIKIGDWNASSGPFHATADMLYQAVAAMDCPAVRNPVLRLGHNQGAEGGYGESPAVIGEPALGYVTNLRVSMGSTLAGDYCGMPKWFADIIGSAYPDRSIEGFQPYVCQLGHEHPFALTAVALLGVERPAVGTLESLNMRTVGELYGVMASGDETSSVPVTVLLKGSEDMPKPIAVTAQATTSDVINQFYDLPAVASNYWVWLEELFIDPAQLIACDDSDGTLWSYTYSVDADGLVTFGEPEQVLRTYVAAAAQKAKPAVSYASAVESRPDAVAARSARAAFKATEAAQTESADAPTDTEGNSEMGLLDEIRSRVGAGDDADEATVLAALDEALNERAEDAPIAEGVAASAANTVTVDKAAFEELQRAATLGAQAHERQETEDRERAVSAAIGDGRIAPAAKDAWLKALGSGPQGSRDAALKTLTELPKGTIPVSPKGHGQGVTDATDGADKLAAGADLLRHGEKVAWVV